VARADATGSAQHWKGLREAQEMQQRAQDRDASQESAPGNQDVDSLINHAHTQMASLKQLLYHVTAPQAGPTPTHQDEDSLRHATAPGFVVADANDVDSWLPNSSSQVCTEPFEEEAPPPTSPGPGLSSTTPLQAGSMHIAFGTRVFDPKLSHLEDQQMVDSELDVEAQQQDMLMLSDAQQERLAQYLELRRLYRPRTCKYTGIVYAEAWNTPGVRKRRQGYSHLGDDLLHEEDEDESAQIEADEGAAALSLLLDADVFDSELARLEQRRHDDLHCTRRCVRTGLLYTEACNHERAARYCPGKIHAQGKFWTCCGQKESEALPCRVGRHEDRPEFAVYHAEYQMSQSLMIGAGEKWSDTQVTNTG